MKNKQTLTDGEYDFFIDTMGEKDGMGLWKYELKKGDTVILSVPDRKTVALTKEEAMMEIMNEDFRLEKQEDEKKKEIRYYKKK